jgi:hypothetical protein
LIGGEIAFVGVWSGWSEVAPLKALAASMTCRITGLTTGVSMFLFMGFVHLVRRSAGTHGSMSITSRMPMDL